MSLFDFSRPNQKGATIVVESGSFTVGQGHNGADIVYNSTSNGTFTIPQGLGVGMQFALTQFAAGKPTYVAGVNVTVISLHSYTGPSGAGAQILLKCVQSLNGVDTYTFNGDGA